MKKFSALLLTGIIGTSMLFAGFAGSAAVEYKLVDLDDTSFTMENKTVIDADLELHADTAGAKGEGDIYAEINATLKVAIDTDESGANATEFTGADFEVKITDASVIGDGWKVSILGVNGPVDYAAAADGYTYGVIDNKANENVGGLAVTLDDYGTVSVGYGGKFKGLGSSDGYLALESNEVEVAENMKATVAGVIGVTGKSDIRGGASAKLAYATDDYSASLATDLGYDATNKFGADVAVNSTMSFVTVDAYFGTRNIDTDYINDTSVKEDDFGNKIVTSEALYQKKVVTVTPSGDVNIAPTVGTVVLNDYYVKDGDKYKQLADPNITFKPGKNPNDANETFSAVVAKEATYRTEHDNKYWNTQNLLNVKVVADLNEINVPVKFTVTGSDLINTQDLSAQADVTVTEELVARVSGGYEIASKDWKVGAGVTYAVDAYTAKLDASFDQDEKLGASASVESSTLINGANLKLAWANANDILKKDADGGKELGSITASCKIAF